MNLPMSALALTGCPYPGLRAFTRDETDVFFGREEQTDRLLELLEAKRFLAVVGPSGCGKSSLIKAGLMADLEGGLMSYAGARWEMAEMCPGYRPFASLADALLDEAPFRSRILPESARDSEAAVGFLRAALRASPMGLAEVLRESNLPPNTNFFLLVDQFEEIFAARSEGAVDETDAFVALLLATAVQREVPIYVVLTMRTDWLGECPVFDGLPEAINESLFLTPRLTRDEKREAIVGPARLFDGSINDDLVNHLLNKTGPNPDQLPLLQHLLMRMWLMASPPGQQAELRREPMTLTYAQYKDAGGFSKGLSKHAGEAYNELTVVQKKVAEVIFRALSQYGSEGRERRRFATVESIASLAGVPAEEVIKVADVFRRPDRSFLMPPLDVPLAPDSILDISHEALIRNWDKLAEWAAEEDKSANRFRWLKQTAHLERIGEASLLEGTALENALEWRKREKPSAEWAKRYGGEFELAMSFLDRSEQARRNRCRKTILRRLIVGSMVLSAAFFGIIITAYVMWQHWERGQKEIHDKYVARALQRLEPTNKSPTKNAEALRDLSKALRTWHKNPATAKEAAKLLHKKWCPPLTPSLLYKPDAPLLAATFGPGNDPIAVAVDGNLLRWKRDNPKALVWKKLVDGGKISSAAFSPDGAWLLFTPSGTMAKGQVELWKSDKNGFHPDQSLKLNGSSDSTPTIRQALWSPDSRLLIVNVGKFSQPDFKMFQRQGEKYEPLNLDALQKATAVNFDRSGKRLAIIDREGNVSLWDTANTSFVSETLPVRLPVDMLPSAVEFVPGTNFMVATTFRGGHWFDTLASVAHPINQPLPQDVLMRFAFAPQSLNGDKIRFAVGLDGRVVFAMAAPDEWNSFAAAAAGDKDLNAVIKDPDYEPIAIHGLSGYPVFSQKGNELLILSGTVWNAWDTIRVWDISGSKAPEETVNEGELDRWDVPVWLADLGLAVSGLSLSDEEEEPLTLERIREKTAPKDIPEGYAYLWRRFFGELPPDPKAKKAQSATSH